MLKLNILGSPTAKIGRSKVDIDLYPVKSRRVFSLQFKLIFRLRSSGSVFQNHDQSATTYPYILEIVEYDIKRTQNTEDDPNIETVGYVVYSSTNWRTQRKKRAILGNCVLV